MAEALASGLSLVLEDVGVIQALVVNNLTGVLVPPVSPPVGGDVSRYVEALEALIRDPARRARLGKAAAASVAGLTWDRAIGALLRGYDTCTRRKRDARMREEGVPLAETTEGGDGEGGAAEASVVDLHIGRGAAAGAAVGVLAAAAPAGAALPGGAARGHGAQRAQRPRSYGAASSRRSRQQGRGGEGAGGRGAGGRGAATGAGAGPFGLHSDTTTTTLASDARAQGSSGAAAFRAAAAREAAAPDEPHGWAIAGTGVGHGEGNWRGDRLIVSTGRPTDMIFRIGGGLPNSYLHEKQAEEEHAAEAAAGAGAGRALLGRREAQGAGAEQLQPREGEARLLPLGVGGGER